MTRSAHPGQPPSRAVAQRERDAALARLSRVRRMTILGAGALTAALAAVVSAIAPGRTLGAKTPVGAGTVLASRSTAGAAGPTMPRPASASQLGLQPPGSAPQAAPAPQPQAPASQPQQQAAPAQSQPAPVSGGS